MPRSTGRIGRLDSPVTHRDLVRKAASDHMQGCSQHTRQIALRTVRVSELNRFLMPIQYLRNLPISQLSGRSAWDFHVRLLIDQAHCLRDLKGTAPAIGHGSIDGPKGRERVRALVRDRLRALCQTPRRRQWFLFFLRAQGRAKRG